MPFLQLAAASGAVTFLQWIAAKSLKTIKEAKDANKYSKDTSLLDVTKLTHVEPLTVISKDCITLDYLPDVMQTLLNVFSAYYLQAVSIYGHVDSVRIMKILDRLNPNREAVPTYMLDALGNTAASGGDIAQTWGMESYDKMPTLVMENYKYELPMSGDNVALEASGKYKKNYRPQSKNSGPKYVKNANNNQQSAGRQQSADQYGDDDDQYADNQSQNTQSGGGYRHRGKPLVNTPPSNKISTGASLDYDTNKTLNEVSNMAVGKVLDVVISIKNGQGEKGGSEKITIPVTVRLTPAILSDSNITSILVFNKEDNSFSERFQAWRAGRISFIKDLIFCQDLIDAHKKALMEDNDGVYSEMIRRATNAKVGGLATKNPSLVSASNLFVISEKIAEDVERKLGGRLSNANVRNTMFQNTYAMIIVVIDRGRELLTFYQRGMAQSATFSLREIKTASKGKGPDIMDLLKAMNMGGQISF